MANRAAMLPALLIATIPFIIASADEDARPQIVCRGGDRKDTWACKIHEMKTRIDQLVLLLGQLCSMEGRVAYISKCIKMKSVLEEKIRSSIMKDIEIEEKKKLIEDMTDKVEVLWGTSRKNNFDIHVLESKLQDVSVRLKAFTAQVEKMTNITTELWIQIRHLEQALQITEKRILKARRRRIYAFLEVIKVSFGSHLSRIILVLDRGLFVEESPLRTYLSQALDQFKVISSSTKSYHHKLQEFIKQKMEGNELTAPLANQEVVFFLASAALTFPTLMAMKFLFAVI
ncbi:hypothetical protein Syun_008554 [Stephania yunnanensis]|uniref:Uncharacterized protein n=1 Tax=Stephania yunnanensis TaxID=152371 RepID=A0AAP0KE16_9MAGN